MIYDENTAIAERLLVERCAPGDLDRIDGIVSPIIIGHGHPDGFPTTTRPPGRASEPDILCHIGYSHSQGHLITQRVTAHAIMKGPLTGPSASGKDAIWTGIHADRIE
jgi:hypothetical protein